MERDRFMSAAEAQAYGLIDAVLEKRAGETVKIGLIRGRLLPFGSRGPALRMRRGLWYSPRRTHR